MLADVRLADAPAGVLTVNAVGDAFAFLAPFGDGWYRVVAWDRRHQPPDTAPVGLDELREVTRRALGTDHGMHDPRWTSRFHSDERQVPKYRVGRVFLAGDAAHVHSPVGGQGMNTGMQDAANLGWKLAAELQGWAPSWLLDSYHEERHPVGRLVVRGSGAALRLVLAAAAVAAPGAVRRGVAVATRVRAGRAEAGGRRLRHRHRLPRAARLPPPHGAACAGRPAGGRRPRAAVRAAGRRAVRARGRGERPRGGVPGVEEVGGTRPLRPGGTRDPHDRAGAAGRVHRVGDRRDRPRPARRGDPRRAQPLVRAARRPPAPRAPPPPRPGAVGDPRIRRRRTGGGQATRDGEPDMTDRTGEAGGRGVARQLIESHLVGGEAAPGREIGVRVDQTLTQDATGTLVMLELEALDLDRVRTDVSVQYVDHNLLQTDERNVADHIFLRSACRRYGLWYSKAGNGVSHPTHMQRFGVPGADDGRRGLPHLRGRVARHARDRRRRAGGRDGDGGRAAARHDAGDLGRAADGGAAAVGERQGRDPGDAAAARGARRRQPDHRVPRARCRVAVRDGPARHRQHGRRAGRDDDGVPLRRAGPGVPARRGPRGRLHRDRRRPRHRLRPRRRDRPVGAGAADRPAGLARQRGPGAGGRRRGGRPGGGRLVGEPGAARLRRRRGDGRGAARRTPRCRWTSTRRRGRSSRTSPAMGATLDLIRRAPASTRPAASAASGWARPPPSAATACEPSRATSPAAPAPRTTRCGCARRRPPRRPR